MRPPRAKRNALVQSENNIGHSSIIPMPIFDFLARRLLETEVSMETNQPTAPS